MIEFHILVNGKQIITQLHDGNMEISKAMSTVRNMIKKEYGKKSDIHIYDIIRKNGKEGK